MFFLIFIYFICIFNLIVVTVVDKSLDALTKFVHTILIGHGIHRIISNWGEFLKKDPTFDDNFFSVPSLNRVRKTSLSNSA